VLKTSRNVVALLGGSLVVAVAVSPAAACSMFTVAFDGHVYMANNEDFIEPGYIWFVPGGKKRNGRVNVGFADRFAQGGMNERGLAFDAAVVAEVPWTPDPDLETPKNLVEQIMDECATVEEAIARFETHNCTHLARTQFMFADRTGASAVVAWLPGRGLSVVRKHGPYQLITNTRLEASSFRCERHVVAQRILGDRSTYELGTVRDALDAMHQRGREAFTSYSTVYDLKAGTVTVYNLADFSRHVTYDLAVELARGKRAYELAKVFESPGALEAIRAAEPRRYDTEIVLATSALQRFTGTYRVQGTPAELRIELREGALVLVPPDGREAHLYPEEPTLFRIREGGQLRFDLGPNNQALGLWLYRFGDHRAVRVEPDVQAP
jgi:hypothetical protein